MLTADDKKFNPPSANGYVPSVTVYFNLEPKQLKIKYEMDSFFFQHRDGLKNAPADGNVVMLVDQYKKAVFHATGVEVGTSTAKTDQKSVKRFDVTA